MQEAQTWRELLGMIITDNREKQRIAEELSISPVTLTRWINGESDPRPQNLRHLIDILPQYRRQFLLLVKGEKGLGDLVSLPAETLDQEISAEFYAQILATRVSTPSKSRLWSICTLIFQRALEQLDPEHLGMAIWVVQCMPPSGPYHKVRSLRENVGWGTPPWTGNLEQKAMFLGAESLAGNVVTLCRPGIIENLDTENSLMPASRAEHEKSSAIYPILYAGRIAGAFLVSSTQYDHFLSQARTNLVQRYADLVALAFEPEDFYAPEDIALNMMPSPEEQKPYFAQFRQLVTNTMIDGASRSQPVNNIQAGEKVWQDLEEELLQYRALKK